MTSETVEVLTERFGAHYRWWASGTALIAIIAMVLSATSVTVAVPHIMGAFGVGQDRAQWVATGYFAAMTAGMLLSVWLVRNFGARVVLTATLAAFTVATFAGAAAASLDVVILSRIIQGACGGLLQPLSMQILFRVFPPERRGTAMGLFGLGVVLAPGFGPALGGLAIDIFDWRWVLLIPLPGVLAALPLGLVFMPERDDAGPRTTFDWQGFALLVTAIVALLDALASGPRLGWSSDRIVFELVLGGVSAAAFILRQVTARSPLLDLSLFRNGRFASAFVVGFIFGFGMFGSIYLIAVFVQTVQGYTAMRAGLLMVPAGLVMAVMFPVAGRINDLVPAHWPIMFGLTVFGAGFLLMATADADTPFWTFALFIMVNRFGLSFVIPSLNTGSLKALRPDQVPQGSGLVNFTRMLGGACGINLLVVLLEMRTSVFAEAFTATQTAANAASMAMLEGVGRLVAADGLGPGEVSAAAAHYLGEIMLAQAQAQAFQDVFVVIGLLAFAALLPAFFMARAGLREPDESASLPSA
ncbi:MAG: DHA2 family efflux MFS transporter permease subunit [Alphaproteobacteria bacterium]|nr:DHA2 family efflux MFS transporter permease subunit [Alphaproteobacteria bacterium]